MAVGPDRRRAMGLLLAAGALPLSACASARRTASAAAPAPGQAPPFALTTEQLFAWSPDGPTADDRNRSREPLAARFVDPGAGRAGDVRVLYAPDGMNDLAAWLEPQAAFNRYSFVHWAQIDLLAWFAGTADLPVHVPARPWVDAAHRNGVKVLGSLFFAPVAWGGAPDTVEAFLRRDADGSFPAADRLIALARHYGFDGWLINQETDLRAPDDPERGARLGREMQAFTAALTRLAPEPMEIHWYDAMLPDGSVRWQNGLTAANAGFLEADGRVSDALFTNYHWTPEALREGARRAERLGRSRYDVFVGVDLWPERDNAQAAFRERDWLRAIADGPDGEPLGSIALFAPHFNFAFTGDARTPRFSRFRDDPADAGAFYDAETRLFAGDDLNMAADDRAAGGWEGLSALVPARSTLARLPFRTAFNTGHGRQNAVEGRPAGGPWHDLSRQDILPSWQFAFTPGAGLRIGYDFDRPWDGGSSLRFELDDARTVEAPLFLSALPLDAPLTLGVVAATDSDRFALRLTMSDGAVSRFDVPAGPGWRRHAWRLASRPGAVIREIAVVAAEGPSTLAVLRLGEIAIAAAPG